MHHHHRSSSSSASVVPVTTQQPLLFQRAPALRNPVDFASASVDEMRDILEVLSAAGDGSDAVPAKRARSKADDAAEKRRKHREAMVLFRLKKKMHFGDMQKKEHTLQDVLQLKLAEYRRLSERRSRADNRSSSSSTKEETAMRALQDEFADVLSVKEALLRENRAMEGVIHELAKFQKLVQDEVDRQAEDDNVNCTTAAESSSSTRKLESASASREGEWVQFLENEQPIYYVPEPKNDNELACESFRRFTALRDGFLHRQFDSTETYCLGWKALHSLVTIPDGKRMLRFRFTRQVPRWFMKLEDYQRLAWPVVHTPELNASLYSTPVHVKVLQWIDENTFITLRNSPHRDRSVHIRYFATNTQVEYRDHLNRRAYAIHHMILDREPLVPPAGESPVTWAKEGVQCMTFTEIPENDAIEIDHFGYMNCVSEEQAHYLMIETCSILMRWEQKVVPPRLLTSD